jgi:hypothetical protein
MSIPPARAASVSAWRVHTLGPDSSPARGCPSACRAGRPGGTRATRAITPERSSSVILRLRPAPGRSPSPSRPSSLNLPIHRRTFRGWQPGFSAISRHEFPAQLNVTIMERSLQSAGACRAPASFRILSSSWSSPGARAINRLGTVKYLLAITMHPTNHAAKRKLTPNQERCTRKAAWAGDGICPHGPGRVPERLSSLGAGDVAVRMARRGFSDAWAWAWVGVVAFWAGAGAGEQVALPD